MGVYAQKIYKLSGLLIHMPPKHVGEELRDLVKKVRDGTFEYKNRDKSEINWVKYDYAQIKEMADYLNNIRDNNMAGHTAKVEKRHNSCYGV